MISESGNSDPDHDAVPVTRSAPGIRFRGSVLADAFKTGAGSESEKTSARFLGARSSVPVLILKAILL